MTDADLPDLDEQLDPAVHTAFSDRGEILTRWVLVAEAINADGQRAVYVSSAPDAQVVDALGLLGFGLEVQRQAFRDEVS